MKRPPQIRASFLRPDELVVDNFAQGFPEDYEIRPTVRGKPLTKTAQIRMAGNSVCPPVAERIVSANVRDAGEAAA